MSSSNIPKISFSVDYDESTQEFTADLGVGSPESDDFLSQIDAKAFDKVHQLACQIAAILGEQAKRIERAEKKEYADRRFYEMSL